MKDRTKVLVIDAIQENAQILSEDLESDGYQAISTTSGKQAIELAEVVQPAVILLDIMTTDIHGFKVCQILKENPATCKIPVILISAREDIDDIIVGLDMGAIDYISKPFHYPIAAARIRSAIRIKISQDKIREINKELEIAKDLAQSSEKTKALFLANMSHEIRTPLNGVLGMSALLMETELGTEQKEFVETINSSGALLMELINNILDYSKFESKNITIENIAFNLAELIEGVKRVMRYNLNSKNLQIETNIDKHIPALLEGDPTRIRQVFMNLISNAIKFSEQGIIQVNVTLVARVVNRYHLRVEVIDHGVGINLEQQAQLFKPFTQADDSTTRIYGGTGLGLAICKETIELLSGTIGVISEIDKGSIFWFELALEGADEALTQPSIGNGYSTALKLNPEGMLTEKHILLVEDNLPNQLFATALLKQTGAKIDIAQNGKVALEKISSHDYDLILMDCQMPVMDGFETTLAIRSGTDHNKDIIIIALTANTMDGDKRQCLDIGMNDYISKPYDKNEFYRVLHHWLVNPELSSSAEL